VGVANLFLDQSIGIDDTNTFLSSMQIVGVTGFRGLWLSSMQIVGVTGFRGLWAFCI